MNSESIKKQPTILRKSISNNNNVSKNNKTKININIEENKIENQLSYEIKNDKQLKISNYQCIKDLELNIIKLQKEILFKKFKLEFYRSKLLQSLHLRDNLYNEDNKPDNKHSKLNVENKFVFDSNNDNIIIKEVIKIPKKDIFKLPDIKAYNKIKHNNIR